MKILAIAGSPRRGGNSELLLDKAIESVESAGCQTEKIILNELKFVGCQECGGCDKTGVCVLQDDMQAIYRKIAAADAIIIAAPIFFGSLPAQVKAMIDRYQCLWITRYVLKKEIKLKPKKGCLILASGTNRDKFFKNAESIVKNFFAVLGIEFAGGFYCPGVDDKAKVLKRPDCLKASFELGQKLVS